MSDQLDLFRHGHPPARRSRHIVFFRCRERVIYPATPYAQRWTVRMALYIAPEGLYRLDWTLVEFSTPRPPINLQVWQTPLPKPKLHA